LVTLGINNLAASIGASGWDRWPPVKLGQGSPLQGYGRGY